MSFHVILQSAKNIFRDPEGIPTSWDVVDDIKSFNDVLMFADYVERHARELTSAVCLTGNSSLLTNANAFLTATLKKKGLLK